MSLLELSTAKGINLDSDKNASSPLDLENRGRTAEFMNSQGSYVGYDEKIPSSVDSAWVIEEGPDGLDISTEVVQPVGAKIIDVFEAAPNKDKILGIKLLGKDKVGEGEQVIFPSGNFDITSEGEVSIPRLGSEPVVRHYAKGDLGAFLPGGFYKGTR